MFRITKENTIIGVTEKLVFTRRAENGCFVECQKSEAEGFVYNGQVYSMGGEDGYQDEAEATVTEFDGGAAITEMQVAIDDLVVASLTAGGAASV